MTDPAAVRTSALALPGAIEADHHGRPSFPVQVFATLWDPEHLNVMLDEDRIRTAVQGIPNAPPASLS